MPALDPAVLKSAIEGRDAATLIGLYADDAVMRVIDRDHPPSSPMELRGKAQIAGFLNDVCGRAMTHRVDASVGDDGHLAFSEACAYPDGTQVYCVAMLDVEGGRIRGQTMVQAWDA